MTTTDPAISQEELLTYLPEGAEPDVYLVIPVAVLARQLGIDWEQIARSHRGEVRLGWLKFRHMRSLMQLGVLVDTKHKASK